MSLFPLEESGLGMWADPGDAAAATIEEQKKLQAMLIATKMAVANEWWGEGNRAKERKFKEALQEINQTGILLASLLRAEQER